MKTYVLREVVPIFRNKRIRLPEKMSKRLKITSAGQAYRLFRDLRSSTKEVVVCLHLDRKNVLLCHEVVSVGTQEASLLSPRHVFRTALLTGAMSVIILHNHPSGDPAPSPEDRAITEKLKAVGQLHEIKLLDHIIVGDRRYFSFADRGLLG